MLKKLIIHNFAIIENMEINFDPDMTILTGQTGSGKSLIVDAISILTGKKAEQVYIRNQMDEAYICGYFVNYLPTIRDMLIENDLLSEEDKNEKSVLKIERTISRNNKNNIKINDKNVTVNLLKQIMNYVCDLHLQNDHFKLLDEANYLDILDRYGNEKITKILNEYNLCLFNYTNSLNKYHSMLTKRDMDLKNLDQMKYQYDEITELNATEEEKVTLKEEIEVLSNYDSIYEVLNETLNILDDDQNGIDRIYRCVKEFHKIAEIKEDYQKMSTVLEEGYYNISDVLKDIRTELRNLDYDPDILNQNIERLNSIYNIEKKYNKIITELNLFRDALKETILMNENYDLFLEELKKDVVRNFQVLTEKSQALTQLRKKIAEEIERGIEKEFADLNLFHVSFKVDFQEISFNNFENKAIFLENGVDKINFLISLNVGEGFKPLNKIASGGEISRIILALKAVLIKKFKFNLVLFDEIDTGVSGEVAVKISRKIKELSHFQQIICISHLPQAAALANQQIEIEKFEENHRTYSRFTKLKREERIYSIAKMLSGEVVTTSALSHAKELLEA